MSVPLALWLIVGNSAFSVTARWSLIRSYRDWRRHMLIDQRGLSFLGLYQRNHHHLLPPWLYSLGIGLIGRSIDLCLSLV
ncbi:hypothetical protein DTO063F5_9002 [Paecilomyces variotii]|nr:hypothetical protein DTO063F5_9002 [Paecilomyces variotii]